MQTQVEDGNFEASQREQLAMLKELFAEVAHETRNILQSISGFVELELATCQSEASRRRLAKALEDCTLVGDLVGSMLKISADGPESGDLNDAIQTVLEIYRYRTRAGITFTWKRRPLPPVAMPTAFLRLVLVNVVKNAVEALDGGGNSAIKVETSEVNGKVLLEIWNSGPHIPDESMNQIFNRYFTTKAMSGGTGIGLSIAQRLLNEAGGTLSARNVAMGGVTFTAQIPVVRAAVVPIPNEMPRMAVPIKQLKGRRILVIDDDSAVRDVLQLMIVEMGGGEVKICSSGDEALAFVGGDAKFDAVLLDLRMSGLSGQQVFDQLPETLRSRVIFISGDTHTLVNTRYEEAAQQPRLLKPLNARRLFDAIDSVCWRATNGA
jgi:CheY-like chemotaxis protein